MPKPFGSDGNGDGNGNKKENPWRSRRRGGEGSSPQSSSASSTPGISYSSSSRTSSSSVSSSTNLRGVPSTYAATAGATQSGARPKSSNGLGVGASATGTDPTISMWRRLVGKIDIKIYSCITKEILSDDIYISDERIKNMNKRDPNFYARYGHYLSEVIESPDYILRNSRLVGENTAVILKEIDGLKFQLILVLKPKNAPRHHTNSVVSFLMLKAPAWNRLISENQVLYSSSDKPVSDGDKKLSEYDITGLKFVGKINIEKFRCVDDKLVDNNIYITDERVDHIKDHHPGHYESFAAYLPEILDEPDYILKDKDGRTNTAVLLKNFLSQKLYFQLVLRLKSENDTTITSSYVVSFWQLHETRWKKLIKNKEILYQKDSLCHEPEKSAPDSDEGSSAIFPTTPDNSREASGDSSRESVRETLGAVGGSSTDASNISSGDSRQLNPNIGPGGKSKSKQKNLAKQYAR